MKDSESGGLAVLAQQLRHVFPPSPDARISLRGGLAVAAALALGTAASLIRQAGVGALSTLYAEDGTIFLSQALHTPTLWTLGWPHGGYLHLLPRLVAGVAGSLPLPSAAIVLSGGAALLLAVMALLVYRASAGHLSRVDLRLALAGSMILLPVGMDEMFNTTANLHFFLVFTAFWVLVWRPSRTWELAAGALTLLFAGLSDPFIGLLGVVAIPRLLLFRGWRDQTFTAAWAAGVGLMAIGIAFTGAHRDLPFRTNLVETGFWYAMLVVGRGTFGTAMLHNIYARSSVALVGGAALLLAAWCGVALRDGRLWQRPLVAAALLMSVILFATPVYLTGVNAPRYSLSPVLLLYSAVVVLLDVRTDAKEASIWRISRAIVFALVLIVWPLNLRVENQRSSGPSWPDGLKAGTAACLDHASQASIPITPEGWAVQLECRDLLQMSS